MGFAEKKVELFKLVADADEELTGKLIEFAQQYGGNERFSEEELKKFHQVSMDYDNNPKSTITMEEAHAYIRSLKNK